MSIALLVPRGDPAVVTWFKKFKAERMPNPRVIHLPHLQARYRHIRHFDYWRERIVIIKQLFDDSEPRGILQWWYDRRRRVQWYTFWIARLALIFVVFFGVIQCIEGGIQAYKAFQT
jgi:hypothetical protein